MLPGELKPILTALAMPPASLLLLLLAGLLLAVRHRRSGLALCWTAGAALWLLSCPAVAHWLGHTLLPEVAIATPERLKGAQAIVVLGGGVRDPAPEYGSPQPGLATLRRLDYAALLARQTGLPLAFSGGVGWTTAGMGVAPEAQVAAATFARWGLALRWSEGRSRDTAENAQEMHKLLRQDGVRRIALVSDSWHLPRAMAEFRRVGLEVVPAPVGSLGDTAVTTLDWLPSAGGLHQTHLVLREALGSAVARMRG